MDNMARIILDTNFLLIPGQFKVQIFEELQDAFILPYRLQIIDKTLDELEKLVKTAKLPDKTAAKIALGLIGCYKVDILPTKRLKSDNVDDLIIETLSHKGPTEKIYVATQDKELKKRVLENNGKIITLRQKKYLKII